MLELVGNKNTLMAMNEESIKKSKFITYIYKVDSEHDAEKIIEDIKKANKDAKHVIYAYRFKETGRYTDDKEPSGTAGKPIFNIIERENIVNILVVVVRYFGGILLGAGPLMRAYVGGYTTAIKNCSLRKYVEYTKKEYIVDYNKEKEIIQQVYKEKGIIISTEYGEKVKIIAEIPNEQN